MARGRRPRNAGIAAREAAKPQPPKPKPKPKPKRKRIVSPDDRSLPRGAETPPKREQGASVAADAGGRRYAGPDLKVVSRQRQLRASGFGVRVDGTWGPRSQIAWQRYQRGERPAHDAEVRARVAAERANAAAAFRRESRKAQVAATVRGERDRERQVAAMLHREFERRLHNHDATEARAGRDFTNRQNRTDTRVALRRERHQIKVIADRARRKAPEKLTLDELVALNFDPVTGDFNPRKAGDVRTVQRWLRAHGHPKLAADGVYGPSTFNALKVSYQRSVTTQRRKAEADLVDLLYRVRAVHPGEAFPVLGRTPSKGELLKILQRGDFTADRIWRSLLLLSKDRGLEFQTFREQTAATLGKEAFGPFYHSLFTNPLQTLRAVQAVGLPAPTRTIVQNGLPAEIALQTPIGALQTSQNFREFKQQIKSLEKAEEKLRAEQFAASQDHPWWQSALDYALVKPGELFRDELVASVQTSYDYLTDFDIDTGSPEERRARAEAWNAQFAKNHKWLNLGYVLVADPLWVAPGVGTVGKFGVQAVLRLERAGYAIERSGALVESARLAPLAKSGMALRAPAITGRALDRFDQHLADAISTMPTVVPLLHFSYQLTRLKGEAIALARRDVNRQLARNFADSEVSTVVRADIDRLAPDIDAHVETMMPQIVRALVDGKASLFVHDVDRELSNVGAMFLFNAKEVIRIHVIEKLAVADARAAYRRALDSGATEEQAVEDLHHAYAATKAKAGFYVVGLPDRGVGARVKEIAEPLQTQFEHVVLPAVQRRLEAAAEARGETLFDEAGSWIGRQGLNAETLRRFGADAYSTRNTIDAHNPIYGRVFDVADRDALVTEEISTRAGTLKAWYTREAAAGRPRAEDWLAGKVEAIDREVRDAWKPTDGGFTDSRPMLKVPVVNARHLNELYGGARPIVDTEHVPNEAVALLKQFAEHPVTALDGDVQSELTNAAWALGGAEEFDAAEPLLAEFLAPLRPREFDLDTAGRFQETVGRMAAVLQAGYGEMLPGALRKQWALWQAFAEAEGRWSRTAYRVVSGGLNAWIFATLPFRPGWVGRNVVDNAAKLLTAGARDPRYYFIGAVEPGARMRSVFEANLRDVRFFAEQMDKLFGTHVADGLETLMESFWQHNSAVLSRIFRAHGIPTPENVFKHGRFDPLDTSLRVARPKLLPDAEEVAATGTKRVSAAVVKFKESAWELMATRPESYFKRIGYRWKYDRVLEQTGDETRAFVEAVDFVDEHLFDYSKVTVLEDNLRLLFPFVMFWRKNTALWARHFVNKPWLPAGIVNFEDQLRDNIHADLPEWTRRYIHADEVGDGIGKIPGLGWLGDYVASIDGMYDPVNYFSFAPMYRAFKENNALLPADKAGIAFLAPMVDAMNDWGLSMNPLIRKPLEAAGVFNYRAWQSIFPQTPIVQALTRKYLNDRWPDGLNLEALLLDPLFEHLGQPSTSELIAQNFNEYVQLEMANQAARGEPVSRAAAEKKLQDFFLAQTIFSYFTGVYARRMTPQDFQLYKILDGLRDESIAFQDLSPEEQRAYKLFRLKGIDKPEFDRYVSLIPLIEAYYAQGDYEAKERMKLDHPEILPFVEPWFSGKGISSNYVQTAALVQDTEVVAQFSQLADELDLPDDVRRAGQSVLVTPSLLAFWERTRSPSKWRDRHLRLLYFRHMDKLNKTFFALPADDFDAKDGYLRQHPELVHFWRHNNDAADDYLSIINSANSDLREAYFEHVDREDWDSADKFLHRYPFIFQFTKAENRVDDEGNWITKKASGHGSTQHSRDYLAAKPSLDVFFGLPEGQRSAWLNADTDAARVVRGYFAKYARRGSRHGRGLTEHARDFLRVKPLLDRFFGIKDEFRKQAWLEHDGPEQKAVLAYFRKWGSKDGNTEHARAYQHAKKALDHYFGLPKQERKKWLNGDSPLAKQALAYFKRWSRLNLMARAWAKKPQSDNPELQLRMEFWHRYFQLPPDERPLYALREAENHGVFIWGPLSAKERHQRESDYLRKVYSFGASRKAAMYLYVQPLLAEFEKLDRDGKQLFLKANPELGEYLDEFSSGSASGDPKLDKLIERYFKLPGDSPERSVFLRAHPEVQRYFDKHSTPAEAAMRRLLQVYFRVPAGQGRKVFLRAHPEIRAYFDKRRAEKDNQRAQLDVFGEIDPRLQRFWKLALTDITQPAAAIKRREEEQSARGHLSDGLERRVDRRLP